MNHQNVILNICDLVKQYDDCVAVDHISLNIGRGEIFALLGASGSGKSTLLRLLAGFETPTSGSIFLNGQDITKLPPYLRPINMMFQSYALFPHMNIEQNIAFGLKQDQLSIPVINKKVEQMLDLVDMARFRKHKPHQLSGGQRQRVALARSLAKSPKLLLLDEPMGALDKQLRSKMQLEIANIIRQVGVTCLIVTHDQEEAMSMADRIGIMDHGWIVQTGSPIDIYETPNSKMTAQFIGSVNLFEGNIVQFSADHSLIESDDLETLIHINHGIEIRQEDRQVWIAIRPEKTKITTKKPDGKYNFSEGVIQEIAYLGTHCLYHIELSSGKRIQSLQTNTERWVEKINKNEQVFVSWDSNCPLVLFE